MPLHPQRLVSYQDRCVRIHRTLRSPSMPWKHWSAERLGLTLAILAALGFSLKAIFVKLAYAVPQATPVDSVTLLALRMIFSLPAFAWVGVSSFSVQ